MEPVTINSLAVLLSGISAMVIGGFWYSPMAFGKKWAELTGMTAEKMAEAKAKGMAKSYAINFVAALIMAYVLAHFVEYLHTYTTGVALQLAFWAWLGFQTTIGIGQVLWEGKTWKLYFINCAYQFVSLSVMALILAYWR